MNARAILRNSIVVILLFVSEMATAQWTSLAPPPTSKYVSAGLVFFDRNEGVFLGSKKLLFRTRDGGETWTNFGTLPPIATYAEMRFVSRDLGYLLADGRLFLSTDQGSTWSELPLAEVLPDTLKSKQFTLQVFADKSLMVRNANVYISSRDSGRTWRIRPAFRHGAWGAGEAQFGTADNGMITDADWYKEINKEPVIAGGVCTTTDGGDRWSGMNIWDDDQPDVRFIWGHDERWLAFARTADHTQMKPIFAERETSYLDWSSSLYTGPLLSDVYDAVFFDGHWIAVGRSDQTMVLVHSLDNGSSWSHFTQFEPKSDALELMVSLDSTTLFALPNYNNLTAYRLDEPLGVGKGVRQDHVHLYPNPSSSCVTIEGAQDGEAVAVYDALGRLVMQQSVAQGRLDVVSLHAGSYTITWSNNRERFVKTP